MNHEEVLYVEHFDLFPDASGFGQVGSGRSPGSQRDQDRMPPPIQSLTAIGDHGLAGTCRNVELRIASPEEARPGGPTTIRGSVHVLGGRRSLPIQSGGDQMVQQRADVCPRRSGRVAIFRLPKQLPENTAQASAGIERQPQLAPPPDPGHYRDGPAAGEKVPHLRNPERFDGVGVGQSILVQPVQQTHVAAHLLDAAHAGAPAFPRQNLGDAVAGEDLLDCRPAESPDLPPAVHDEVVGVQRQPPLPQVIRHHEEQGEGPLAELYARGVVPQPFVQARLRFNDRCGASQVTGTASRTCLAMSSTWHGPVLPRDSREAVSLSAHRDRSCQGQCVSTSSSGGERPPRRYHRGHAKLDAFVRPDPACRGGIVPTLISVLAAGCAEDASPTAPVLPEPPAPESPAPAPIQAEEVADRETLKRFVEAAANEASTKFADDDEAYAFFDATFRPE